MSSNIGFLNVLPDSFKRYSPASTTQASQRKQDVVFIADQASNGFQYGRSSVIQINVQSNSEVMLGNESYLEFDLTVYWSTLVDFGADPASTQQDKNLRLEMGGAHALFNRLEVKTNLSAQTIGLRELYNTEYVAKSRSSRIPGVSNISADLDGFEQEQSHIGVVSSLQNGFQTLHEVTASMTGGSDNLTAVAMDRNGPWRPANAAGAIDRAQTVSTSDNVIGGDTAYKQRVRMRLNEPFLRANIPLWLMPNGFQIQLTLESPSRVFYSHPYNLNAVLDNATTCHESFVGYNYKIENPRFVAMMLQPSEDQVARYVQEYRSPQGLMFPCPGYRVLRTNVAASNTTMSLSMLPGCRSLRYIIGGFFNSTVQMSSALYATRMPLVNHSHMPYYIPTDYYSWNIGSTSFPGYTQNISQGNDYAATHSLMEGLTVLLKRMQLVFSSPNCEMYHYFRQPLRVIQPTAAADYAGTAFRHRTAYPGWFCQDVSRDNGPNSELTGVDVSVTPLEFRWKIMSGISSLTSAGAPWLTMTSADTFEFICFAYFDQWFQMSSAGYLMMN